MSPGVAIAVACRLAGTRRRVPDHQLAEKDIPAELDALREALEATRQDLAGLRGEVGRDSGAAEIISVQQLLLDDRQLHRQVEAEIRRGVNAPQAVERVMGNYLGSLGRVRTIHGVRLSEKKHDLEDVTRRLVNNLLGEKSDLAGIDAPVVIVARDLSPSETASFKTRRVLAFATDFGGPTSHTAIMARSLEIPAVVGLKRVTAAVKTGDTVVVDGREGVVLINPDQPVIEKYQRLRDGFRREHQALAPVRETVSTRDGYPVPVGANIELPDEIASAQAHGADHIGLFRTEFIYLNRDDLPGEEEQFAIYRRGAERLRPRPLVIRTLDLGGDKFASGLEMHEEGNPFLGWRAIRFCLARPDIFRVQLRAVLRASHYGALRLMYPLVTDVSEIRQANRILNAVREELRAEGRPFAATLPVGAMIEVPSAALQAGALAREVDFFSIGTNDLIQYALAVDRGNDRTAYLYNPLHPAVLRLVAVTAEAGARAGIPVAVCGEMASDPALAFLLLGLGIAELSMAPMAIPGVKHLLRVVSRDEAVAFAREILTLDAAAEVKKRVTRKYGDLSARLAPKDRPAS